MTPPCYAREMEDGCGADTLIWDDLLADIHVV
jgi:hypothetical protein